MRSKKLFFLQGCGMLFDNPLYVLSKILRWYAAGHNYWYYDMVAKSIGDDTNNKQLLILPFDNWIQFMNSI